MKKPDLKTFDVAIAKSFAPIANHLKLQVRKLAEGVYEIESREFTVRIRHGTGHRKDILITFLPTAERPIDVGDLSKEIGLGVVVRFNGETLSDMQFDTEDEYLRYARDLAEAVKKYLVPYLLGLRTDFPEIKEFVAANAEKAVNEISGYRLPKNVRKEWI